MKWNRMIAINQEHYEENGVGSNIDLDTTNSAIDF